MEKERERQAVSLPASGHRLSVINTPADLLAEQLQRLSNFYCRPRRQRAIYPPLVRLQASSIGERTPHLTIDVIRQTGAPETLVVRAIVNDLVAVTCDCMNVDLAFVVKVSGIQKRFMPVSVIVTSLFLSPSVMFLWERMRL